MDSISRVWKICKQQGHKPYIQFNTSPTVQEKHEAIPKFNTSNGARADASLWALSSQVTSIPASRLPVLSITQLPSQLQIKYHCPVLWSVANYTAYWQRHVCEQLAQSYHNINFNCDFNSLTIAQNIRILLLYSLSFFYESYYNIYRHIDKAARLHVLNS